MTTNLLQKTCIYFIQSRLFKTRSVIRSCDFNYLKYGISMFKIKYLINFYITTVLLTTNYLSAGVLKDKYPFNELTMPSIRSFNNVKIAIIDTGIDYDNSSLRNNLITIDLNGALIPANKRNFGVDDSHNSKMKRRPIDYHGHGTHIAGIIHEINPEAKLLSIKYYNVEATEEENLKATVKAIYTAIKADVDIINYSSGGEGYSQEEFKALRLAKEKGILVVAAAGNFGKNIDIEPSSYYPASYNLNNIISVVNLNKQNQLHRTSNFGMQNADLASFGTEVTSFLPNSKLGKLSGTSQATAIISAYASLMISSSKQKLNYTVIKNHLLNSTKKLKSLKGKCKTEALFDSSKFIKNLKEKNREIAQAKEKYK